MVDKDSIGPLDMLMPAVWLHATKGLSYNVFMLQTNHIRQWSQSRLNATSRAEITADDLGATQFSKVQPSIFNAMPCMRLYAQTKEVD